MTERVSALTPLDEARADILALKLMTAAALTAIVASTHEKESEGATFLRELRGLIDDQLQFIEFTEPSAADAWKSRIRSSFDDVYKMIAMPPDV